MGVASIEVLNLAFLIILVIPIFMINRTIGIVQTKKIVVAIMRMVIQLSIVGIYLQYIFDLNNIGLNIAYIVVMMIVATISIGGAIPIKRSISFVPVLVSLFIPNIFMLLFFNGVVIQINQIFDAKYIITIGGMLLGNGLSGNIIGLSTFYNGLIKNEDVYQYDLMLGATKFEALKPYFKEAVLVSINPTIASIATIGLVSLPGMMTGQILGGTIPIEAIRYQIAIMVAIFITKYFNIYLAIILSAKNMFNSKCQLKKQFLKEEVQS